MKLSQSQNLSNWVQALQQQPHIEDRVSYLLQEAPHLADLLSLRPDWWATSSLESRWIALQLALLKFLPATLTDAQLNLYIQSLEPADAFFYKIGGLLGYQSLMEHLLSSSTKESDIHLSAPPTVDIREPSVRQHWTYEGLKLLSSTAEIYPIGGAGDRLGYRDPDTGEPLPVALFPFGGKNLLERMIEDLFAREWIWFRLSGKQVRVPLVFMTSHEKQNAQRIQNYIDEKNSWARGFETIRILHQPLVPVIDPTGKWVFLEEGRPFLKPGGHGVLWKLLEEDGILHWLQTLRCLYAVVRQVNNPLANANLNLAALVGYGGHRKASFGLTVCDRPIGAAEGMICLATRQIDSEYQAWLTNIEYTDFKKAGLEDLPRGTGSPFSPYPGNLNLLFCNLKALKPALQNHSIPGVILNFKQTDVPYANGMQRELVGRLESSMQNLSDAFPTSLPSISKAYDADNLHAFALFIERSAGMSAIKNEWKQTSQQLFETERGAYFDYLSLLFLQLRKAGWTLPQWTDPYEAPPIQIEWLPALAPTEELVRQRLRNGKVSPTSELYLDLAEAYLDQVSIKGSLRVHAQQPYGKLIENQVVFSSLCGQVWLEEISIENQGKDQGCFILLEGSSSLFAKNLCLYGPVKIVVPDGCCMELLAADNEQGFEMRCHPWKGDYFLFPSQRNASSKS